MRTRLICGCALLLALLAGAQARASEGFEELVAQVRSGTNDAALAAYIAASPVAYDLTVDEILFLSDLGVSSETIAAAIDHGKKLSAAAPSVPPPADTPVPPTSVPPTEDTPVPPPPPEETPFVDLSGGQATVPPATAVVQAPVYAAPTAALPPPESTDVSYFYQSMAPYGSWLNLEDGWYWQPTVMVVNREWRPYCERGHWVYTDCGWLWQSDYSWGWAPFHYGRWRHHARYGWVWMPDTVWGPAWVVWRGGEAAVGWAPLPPGAVFEPGGGFSFHDRHAQAGFAFELDEGAFTFVESAHFCEPALSRHRLQREEALRVYNNTTIIQDSYTFNDRRIFNHGPPVGRIAGATHRKISPIRILDQPAPSGRPSRTGVAAGETINVFRPHVSPTTHEMPDAIAVRARAQSAAARHVGSAVRDSRPVAGAPQPALLDYGNGSNTRTFSERGLSSRAAAGATIVRTPVPSAMGSEAAAGRNHADLEQQAHAVAAAARQRQAEEVAARQQQQQELQRRMQDTARQQELQRRTQDTQRQQETQRQAQDAMRQQQQELQRRMQDAARQQDVQRRVQESQRQQEAQRQALQSQRQAEEAVARRQEVVVRQQEAQRRAPDTVVRERAQRPAQSPSANAIQDYGNGQLTGAASARGASSRDGASRGGR